MADMATRQIRSAILSGELPPGARIRQEELADRLAVSRAPVRQALLVLEQEGLVLTDRGRGATVAPLEVGLIRDLYQFRGIIERDVAATLASRTDFQPIAIKKTMAAGRAAVEKHDTSRLIELDLEFHTGLYEAIGNRVLSEVMRGQWTHIRRVMAGTLTISGYPQQVWSEHGAILEAIESHNVNLAGMRAAAHTEAASTRLIQNLTEALGKSQQEHAIVVEAPGRRSR